MTSDVPGRDVKDPPLAEQFAPTVARLHSEGLGRNAIARELGISTATVSSAARIAGVSFDTSGTEVATRSRVQQLAEARVDLADMAADLATRAGRRLRVELDANVLSPNNVRTLGIAFGIAVDKLVALSAEVTDERDEHAAASVWLEGLQLQIQAAADGLMPTDERGNVPFEVGPPRNLG
ncbi:UNVERIFIED_ORG: hypothetical protein EDC92_1591 [Dietzia maris]|uniref:helix-turn-helix domain-containing protein n=1 Tax=Dietzia TaxID=37914 RepID=UPI000BDEDFF4|nr:MULTISPECIES: helix-turn-helix domain-containing protein [unclassified Dietzia]MCY1656012.1 helix-turn-helix domain-containing protein [Dietzia sp. SL131]